MAPIEQENSTWSTLTKVRRVIAVLDMVESVRLVANFEDDVIGRWRQFVQDVREHVLPAHQGRLVKSLGDGLMLEFPSALDAVNAVWKAHQRISACNEGCRPGAEIWLRAGIHESDIVVDDLDVYGAGVNLAARLATLAGPGETIASAQVRDNLVDGLDVDIQDLGPCYLKNMEAPQRAFRVGPVGDSSSAWRDLSAGAHERVSVAVLPFAVQSRESAANILGDVLADDLIAQLSRQKPLQVVSRLSTTGFRDRHQNLDTVAERLGTHYVVHGTCVVDGESFRLRVQLVDTRTHEVVWSDICDGHIRDVLMGDGAWVARLTENICNALVGGEVQRALTEPLPTLQSYTILLGAISLMYRLSMTDFERSREMLNYLIERHPRATAPRAWLGKWHVMRVAQGWTQDPQADAHAAHRSVDRALQLEPHHGLALAIDGMICAYINKDFGCAAARYRAAIQANPNESLAWVGQSGLHAYSGDGDEAVACAMQAQRLSPLDPMKFYYDNFTSMALLAQGDCSGAIRYGLRSLRSNRTHGSTLRILAIAQQMEGQASEASNTVQEMLRLEPGLTVSRWMERYPGAQAPHAQAYAQALLGAGMPA